MLAMLSRALRTLLGIVVGAIVLLMLLAGGLWWWTDTEGSLDWALRRAARDLPVTLEGVTGSLRDGLRIERFVWEKDGLKVEARKVHLEWNAPALVRRTVQVDELEAASVIVTDKRPATGEPFSLPASLALPMRVVVDKFSVGEIDYRNGVAVNAKGAAGSYRFGGLKHELVIDGVRWAEGRYGGKLELGATGDMKVDARVRGALSTPVPGAQEKVPLEFEATARGTVRTLDVQALLSARPDVKATQPPRATVTAHVTPFADQPVPRANAVLQRVDVGALWPQAPRTLLSGRVEVKPAGTATWVVSADLDNAAAGPWDQGRLPASALRGAGEWHGGAVLVRELFASVGGGEVRAKGEWRAGGWEVDANVKGVNPAEVYGTLAPMNVSGKAQARQVKDGIAFDVDLAGQARARPAARPSAQPSAGGDAASALAALQIQQLLARGQWAGDTLTLQTLQARASDAQLRGTLAANIKARSGSGRLELDAPGMNARVDGSISASRGGGKVEVRASDLARVQQWLRGVPLVPSALVATPVAGQALTAFTWQGGWNDPAVQGSITSPQVRWGSGDAAWAVRDVSATVAGRLRDAQLQLRALAQQGTRSVQANLSARGGKAGAEWRAAVSEFRFALKDPSLGGGEIPWELQSRTPFDLQWADGVLATSAGEATLSAPATGASRTPPATLAWSPIRWGGGELRSQGRIAGLPMSWLSIVGGPQLAGGALSGDMVFDGQWNAQLARDLRLDATLSRVRGDIDVFAESDEGVGRRVKAGVRDAGVRVRAQAGRVELSARWDSERAGTATAEVSSRLVPGGALGWQWPQDAPLQGRVRAELPRIGIWSLLAPPGWRLRGTVRADVEIAGTRAAPRPSGIVSGDELALRSVVDGVELRDGRLRVRLDGDRLRVEELLLRGAGEGEGGGTLTARGEGRWTAAGPEFDASVQLAKLRASIRADRRITMSGTLDAKVTPQRAEVDGRLSVDEAVITIPEESAPQLGDDVVVRNAPGQIATADERKRQPPPQRAEGQAAQRPMRASLRISLGNAFRLQGRGVDTRLAGDVEVTATSLREPRLNGTVRTVGGRYRAYGQQLDIERGEIRFTGPPDNPALDVLAIRPRMEQRVGVMVTGRAQSPVVRLYSEPDMADAQKLTLLVTGKPTAATGAEAALVQQAALALLAARGGGKSGPGIAGRLGLDNLSVSRGSEGAMVSLGKRFADNFYASYERTLSGGMGTLYIFYELSRRMKVRAEAGQASAIDLIFTFAW
ncbi:translocation/assembly module TamB domain-containing protein [Ramlibacter sp.]|uniref:translocation/assembly module TamB domain-containing protein n=1 Tax=Ramlibacter sp. TaxID=1917967 RepID=UPI003D0DA0BD